MIVPLQIPGKYLKSVPQRYELKFQVPRRHFSGLKYLLAQRLQADSHNAACGYQVRSLYLDTDRLHLYQEKCAGYSQRVKARLRFYNNDWQPLFAELKIKNGARGYKLRQACKLARADLQPTRLSRALPRLAYRPFVQMVQEYGLQAACWIIYQRYAFSYRELRITLDFNLQVAHPYQPTQGMTFFPPHAFIMEIKYSHYFPNWIQQLVQELDILPHALSKYGMGIERLLQVHHYV